MSKTVFASEPQKLSIMRTSWVANETFKHHVCHTNKAEGALMNNRLTPICNEEYISFYLCLLRFSQKHVNSEVQKPTDDCVFHCRQSS